MKSKRTRLKALRFRSNDFRLTAAIGASGQGKTRAFEGVGYNGGIFFPTITIGTRSISGPTVLDLDSLRFKGQELPVLDDHDDTTDGLIGRSLSVSVVNYTLPVAGVIYTEKDRAKKILDANDGGHAWQLSVGVDDFTIQQIPSGVPFVVNGQTIQGPFTLLRNAYLTDFSFVSVGGDDTTWARIAARRAHSFARARKPSSNRKGCAMTFEEWMAAQNAGVDTSTLSADDLASYRADFAKAQPDDDRDDEEQDDDDELTDEEQQAALKAARSQKKKARASGQKKPIGTDGASMDRQVDRAVSEAIRATRLEAARIAHINAIAGDDLEGAAKAISEGVSAKDFELAKLRAGRTKPSAAVSGQDTDADDEHQVVEAALLLNCNFPQDRLGKYFSQAIMNRAMAGRYRGFSLVELGDRLIKKAQVHYQGARNQTGHMVAVRNACAKLQASGFTSMTLSSILENAADKVLLDSYQAVETTWQLLCAIRSLNDFKIHSQYALDPQSIFQIVGSQGDFANLKFGDRKYSLQASSYGVRFKIDFQVWRNDDLGAINDRIGQVGILGAQTIEQVVHYLIMSGINNTALFHSQNANYDVTSNSVFGINGLTFAETMWRNQVRQNNTPLGISPQTLLVGTALRPAASQVFTSARLNEVFTASQTRTGPVAQDNPFVNKYQPVADPYLNNTLLKNQTGETTVAIPHQDPGLWMLFARQGNLAPIHIGFLDGMQSPKIEIIQNQSEMVGFELAAALHFGVGYGDPKLASCFNPNNA